MVYPHLIPPKAGPVEPPQPPRVSETDSNRRNRRAREDPEVSEVINEPASTATVALKADRYRPRIYGFQLHEIAKLQRWQEAVRDRQVNSITWRVMTFLISFTRQVSRLEALEELS